MPYMPKDVNGSPYRDSSLSVQVRGSRYDIVDVQVQHDYDRRLMANAKQAGQVVMEIRESMIRELAEQLYDLMDFEDYEDLASFRIVMRGKIRVLRKEGT
jgi:hypothetical protein